MTFWVGDFITLHVSALGAAIAAVALGLFALYAGLYLLLDRHNLSVRAFVFLQMTLMCYLLGYALYTFSTEVRAVDFWTWVCYTGVALTPLTFHFFVKAILKSPHSGFTIVIITLCVLLMLLVWVDSRYLITQDLETLIFTSHLTMHKGSAFPVFTVLIFGMLISTYASFVWQTQHTPASYPDIWMLSVGFAAGIVSSIYDSTIAMGLVAGEAQPWLGPLAASVMAGIYLGKSLAARGYALERRVAELNSLQVVGRAVSSSLNLDTILITIYGQVSKLMPAAIFYVALRDVEGGGITFPLVVEDGRRVQWPARWGGKGLTEYLLRTRQPLLIRDNFNEALKTLKVDSIGRKAVCWLGVPILVGDEALGVMTVQSLTTPRLYDASHQELLMIIAAQAAVVIQNATLYSRTDEALARRVQELDSVLRTTSDGILLLDQQFQVLAVNSALTNFLGLTREAWMGRYLVEAQPGGGDLLELTGYDPEGLRDDCEQIREVPGAIEKTILHFPGPPIRYLERTLAAVRNVQDGLITGWLLIFHDITEERTLAEKREEFTHLLVHDLRSPMTIVNCTLDMIQDDLSAGTLDQLPNLARMAKNNSDRVLFLVQQVLDINRLEEGQLPLYPEVVDLPALLKEGAARMQPLIVGAGIDIHVVCEPAQLSIMADPELLRRAIHNLLDNAIKYSPKAGHITLAARHEVFKEVPHVLISVADQGPGIPVEVQARLFKKFQQGNDQGSRKRGTGLGLLFCRLVAESHGGTIWVESELGQGSIFTMSLPFETTLAAYET